MEVILRICLFISGLINLFPSMLAFLPSKIQSSYGIEILDANYELILRHRAVLFGIIGGLIIYSAISRSNYMLAVVVGLVSMSSFVLLFGSIDGVINSELRKVMHIDMVTSIVLLLAYCLFNWTS